MSVGMLPPAPDVTPADELGYSLLPERLSSLLSRSRPMQPN